MKTAIIIPARLKSTRLPNKILLDINGKPLIQRVYEACQKSKVCDEIYIAVDDKKVKSICNNFTNNVMLTDPNNQSGTERIVEAIKNIDTDIVVNVQGDEPLIDSETIDKLFFSFINDNTISVASAYSKIKNKKEINDPNVVKVITDVNSNAIYFSRHAIPFNRDNKELTTENYKKHIGIYGYTRSFLKKFSSLKKSYLEQSEKLEQLKIIENGYKIRMIKVNAFGKGIDTQEDLDRIRLILK